MEGEMRTALLLLTLVAALSLAPSDARAAFNCFQTPDGEHRCACVGAENCNTKSRTSAKQTLHATIVSLVSLSAAAERRGLHGRVYEEPRGVQLIPLHRFPLNSAGYPLLSALWHALTMARSYYGNGRPQWPSTVREVVENIEPVNGS